MTSTTGLTVWQLARLARCYDPDSLDSPGADFLRQVADAADELRAEAGATERWQDGTDRIHEAADAAVPVYDHDRWQVFVDLAAYDLSGLIPAHNLTGSAGVALYLVAETLLTALLKVDYGR